MNNQTEAYEGWAIIELMGHTRVAGLVSIGAFGAMPATRLDIYVGDAEKPTATQFLPNGDAVFRATPTTEAICREVSRRSDHQPVSCWELPALPSHPIDDDNEDDC